MEKIGMPVTASTYGNYGDSPGGGSSWGGGGGAYGQPGGAGVPGGMPGPGGVNPSTGQPDYSAQWADYYRSVGMLREAEAIEQQMRVIYFCSELGGDTIGHRDLHARHHPADPVCSHG